jgi:hypothetical protein
MMLQIEPNAVEAEQADEFIDRGVDKVATGDESRFVLAEFGFDTTETH